VNRVAEQLAREANRRFAGQTDGFFAWTHPYGCSQLGDDHETTQRILAGLVRHPNAAGVLVLGLGCENNLIASFREVLGPVDSEQVLFLETQQVADEQAQGMLLLEQLATRAAACRREKVPLSELVIGLKCGGSDGLSGITANPLAGMVSDRVIAQGGTALLTEVPEMFGAETILMNRCGTRKDFERLVAVIDGFKDYYTRHGQPVNENPSPGNKEGGITTLEEKSLGCIQKGGASPVAGILRYGAPVRKKGLNLLEGPGNDIVSLTALAASGAHLTLFTTGRGTPLGGPVPTVKISSNDALAEKKPHWIDFNAGRILTEDPDAVAEELLELVVAIASGETRTRNEARDFREIAIFKNGVTL
jgi:altronate hydrolase